MTQPHRDQPTSRTDRTRSPARKPSMEMLEPRLLLAGDLLSVTKIEADNRGLIVLSVSADLQGFTLNRNAVRVTTAGEDKVFNTDDDVTAGLGDVTYVRSSRTISIQATVAANQRFRVSLDAEQIRDTNGRLLDGEFTGASSVSGDGVEGGDLVFFSRAPAAQAIRMFTTSGTIYLDLLPNVAPITVRNFLAYADEQSYDTTFFHRFAQSNGQPFVLQGGGFSTAAGFPAIPAKPAIQNEFSVSNTRGTVAMAKLGGNPNSATNQFFFNLNNNASNLDNQNGGFTVFARVRDAASLAVMDALAGFPTFDASAQNSAFNELPVLDRPTVVARGSAIASDLVTVTRVALLVDVGGAPGQELSTQGALTFSAAGGATVTIVDLTGQGFGSTDFAAVRFGAAGIVQSITISKDFNGSAGIVVTGATRVNSITDSRRSGSSGTVSFIAIQDGSLGSLNLRGSLAGSSVNGFVVGPGFELPADVDNDGNTTDLTAVFAPGTAASSTFSIAGDAGGSITVGGALRSLRITGDSNDVDIRTGGTVNDFATFNFGRTDNSSISTPQSVSSISAVNWRVSGTARKSILAPTVQKLAMTGAGGERAVFEAQLNLSGPGQGAPTTRLTLGSATVPGGVFASTWNIAGSAGTIDVGDADRWTISVSQNASRIRMLRASGSDVTVTGTLRQFRATEWYIGRVRAGVLSDFGVNEGGRNGGNGTFEGQLNITSTSGTGLGKAQVQNGMVNSTFDSRSRVATLRVGGTTSASTFTFATGYDNVTLGRLTTTNITAQGQADRLSVRSWDGGTLGGGTINVVNITGGSGDSGDARFNVTNADAVLNLNVAGNLTTTWTTRGGFNYRVKGDLIDSNISLTFTQVLTSLRTFNIGGTMLNSNFRAVASVTTVSVGKMDNSGIYVGAPTNQIGLPANAANTNDAAKIDKLTIFGRGSGDSFLNSFVVTGRIGTAVITRPDRLNNGIIHGVAANRMSSITVKFRGNQVTFTNPRATITSLDNFRIQLNPAAPSA